MFFSTSGNRAETSLPIVIAAIVFCIASFLDSIVRSYHYDTRVFALPFICVLGHEAIAQLKRFT